MLLETRNDCRTAIGSGVIAANNRPAPLLAGQQIRIPLDAGLTVRAEYACSYHHHHLGLIIRVSHVN